MKSNILFIVIDSVNAKKFYGPLKKSLTPNIDKLMENGQYFSQAISTGDGTIISWASMLTGLYPFKTGIVSEKLNKANTNIKNCFEIFKENGYHFYCHAPFISSTVGLFPPPENQDSFFEMYLSVHDGLGEKIIKMFDSDLNQPWITYLHFEDLHFPVIVDKEFENESFGPTNFDKSMSGLDYWIGKILDKIKLENTIILITADHGSYVQSIERQNKTISFEINSKLQIKTGNLVKKTPKVFEPLKRETFFQLEKIRKKIKINKFKNMNLEPFEKRALLWQRSDKDHFLFDEKIHVPLLFCVPTIMKKNILEQQVSTMDILPTLCELANIPFQEYNFDGKSLVDLLNGKTQVEFPAYIESAHLSLEIITNDVIGIRTSEFKYFRDRNNPKKRIHLFDLKNDPNENENIATKKPNIVNNLEEILQNILSKKTIQIHTEKSDETKKIEDELRKLGYL